MKVKVYKVRKFIKLGLTFFFISFLLFTSTLSAQTKKDTSYGGMFSFGMRNTISAFTDAQSIGMGAGGEFRIRLAKQINTEWFADYIATDIQGLGYRHDAHIGWSVLFYFSNNPMQKGKVTPYFLAGHCFDYTEVVSEWPGVQTGVRWSSAVQCGFGIHYNITKFFDISLLSQYMVHLGTDINSSIATDPATGYNYMNITRQSGFSLEGHLLTTLSVNYQLGKLWGKK
ncbi:MAG TPA: hypothetical protein VK809_13165 [Bacteroidia bacterium]|jgi:hypothetical protein|nr:hypothetical protein [Bacteroidia bacterium]